MVVCTGDVRIIKNPDHLPMSYTDPENPNMTVGIQDPVNDIGRVVDVRLQHAFTEAVLDQLAANGTNVEKHRRKLREQQNALVPAIEYKLSQ